MSQMVMLMEGTGPFEYRPVPGRRSGGVVEIAAGHANKYIIALVGELSRFGCFVRTCESMPVGTKVSLKITDNGSEFSTPGEVAYILSEKGMGITFTLATRKDEALLEAWLRHITV